MKDSTSTSQPCETSPKLPTREELQAELLQVPEPPEVPSQPSEPGVEEILAAALRYVRAKRGGDLLATLLVGSAGRRALTRHSDLDLIAIVKGRDEGEDLFRVSDRFVEVRYRGYQAVEEELSSAPRLPPLLRKARVLFELEATGIKLVEKAAQRFRQGPPAASLNEKIRFKVDCLHWLGKAEDLLSQPATAQYLLSRFLDELLLAFFRLRGFWPTPPADTLRFVSSRHAEVGELVDRFLTEADLADRIKLGRQLAHLLFTDIPNPPRVD